jgi:uncharacterized protein with PQ loop repeat
MTSAVMIPGYAACAVTALTFLPRVSKTWNEKSAKNLSLTKFVITNVIMIIMCSKVITLKLRYK